VTPGLKAAVRFGSGFLGKMPIRPGEEVGETMMAKFKSRSGWVLGMVATLVLLPSAPGHATDDHDQSSRQTLADSLNSQISGKDTEIQETRDKIRANERQIADIRSGNSAGNEDTGFGGSLTDGCSNCHPSQGGCVDTIWHRVTGGTAPTSADYFGDRPENTTCMKLYNRVRGNVDTIASMGDTGSACVEAIQGCAAVGADRNIRRLEAENRRLNDDLRQLRADREQIEHEVEQARRDCPNCEMLAAMRPRDPGWADYALGALKSWPPWGWGSAA